MLATSRRDEIIEILNHKFSPQYLEVIDESHKHAGHAGARPEGQTHYRIKISASHFDGMSRVAQHRTVMSVLDAQFKSGLHALAIEIVREPSGDGSQGDRPAKPGVIQPDA